MLRPHIISTVRTVTEADPKAVRRFSATHDKTYPRMLWNCARQSLSRISTTGLTYSLQSRQVEKEFTTEAFNPCLPYITSILTLMDLLVALPSVDIAGVTIRGSSHPNLRCWKLQLRKFSAVIAYSTRLPS